MMSASFHAAATAIRDVDALLITAGAGIGVDSGLPDFRGKEGFWKAYPVAARLNLSFMDLANPYWFAKDPALAWAFYGHRLNLYRRTIPHAGFATLLRWAEKKPAGYFVFTSNVDGHFQKAGFDPNRIVECHGSIHHFQCVADCSNSIWDASAEQVTVDESSFRAAEPFPSCPECKKLARPNILMFGDYSWHSDRTDAQHQAFENWQQELEKKSARVAVIELGAGSAIPTVRHASELFAERFSGKLIRVNPREPEAPTGHFSFASPALAGIQEMDESLNK